MIGNDIPESGNLRDQVGTLERYLDDKVKENGRLAEAVIQAQVRARALMQRIQVLQTSHHAMVEALLEVADACDLADFARDEGVYATVLAALFNAGAQEAPQKHDDTT